MKEVDELERTIKNCIKKAKLNSRAKALTLGENKYKGSKCSRCSTKWKYTRNYECVMCAKLKMKERRKKQ